MHNNNSYNVSIKLSRESFPLYLDRPTSYVYGVLQLLPKSPSVSTSIQPPPVTTARIQLIGKEHIGTRVLKTVFDDTYTLSSIFTPWQTVELNSSQQQPFTQAYQLPFELNIPSRTLPNSFQMCLEHNSDTIGIDYLLKSTIVFHTDNSNGSDLELNEDRTNTMEEDNHIALKQRKREEVVIVYPVHLHRAYSQSTAWHCLSVSPTLSSTAIRTQNQQKHKQRWPSKVRWGTIMNQKQQQAWHYEIEYPNVFELDDMLDMTGYIGVRLKSAAPPHKPANNNESSRGNSSNTSVNRFWRKGQQAASNNQDNRDKFCLIGYQVLQMVEIDGFRTYYQVLSASTECMKLSSVIKKEQNWSEPCDINFDLLEHQQYQTTDDDSSGWDSNWIILPTVPTSEYQSLAVEHCIQLTIAIDDVDKVEMFLPISIVGYSTLSLLNQSFITTTTTTAATDNNNNTINANTKQCQESVVGCSPSNSSLYSVEEIASHDSAIDVNSYRSSASSSSAKTIQLNALLDLNETGFKISFIPDQPLAAREQL